MSRWPRVLAATFGGQDATEIDLHAMFNMADHAIGFDLPAIPGREWRRVLDTSLPSPNDIVPPGHEVRVTGQEYLVNGRSIVLLGSFDRGQ